MTVFHPGSTPKFDSPKIILGVANIWERRKGLADFFKLNELLDDKFKIVLVGLTQKQISSLPNGIHGITRTNSVNELVNLYSQAFVFVNPTWEDNFPTTNIEALACGTPVITYRTGGSVEALDESTGIVVEQGDVLGLKRAIDQITISENKFSISQCRDRAQYLYNKNDRFQEYIDLYNNLTLHL